MTSINTYQRLRKFILIVPAICLFVSFSSAKSILLLSSNIEMAMLENISIEGIVRDEEGKLIKDATVAIKGTRNSATTSEKGTFKLTDVAIGSTLTITHSSYELYTIEVTGVTTLDVIVLQKRSSANLTGTQNALTERLLTNAAMPQQEYYQPDLKYGRDKAVEGILEYPYLKKFPTPSQTPIRKANLPDQKNFRINCHCGSDKLGSDKQPLFIVDGKTRKYEEVLESIDPEDIESLTVIKDNLSLLEYGPAAANGVIKIETKKK